MKKVIDIILFILFVALGIFLADKVRSCKRIEQDKTNIPASDPYNKELKRQIQACYAIIDSLYLANNEYKAQNEKLKTKYDNLVKKKSQSVQNYHQLKSDKRAEAFLQSTQKAQVITAVFIHDSLLVPMQNVDSAMTLIIGKAYSDTLLAIQSQCIDTLEKQVNTLTLLAKQYVELDQAKDQKIELLETSLIRSENYNKEIEKKMKWLRITGLAKDVLLAAAVVMVVI